MIIEIGDKNLITENEDFWIAPDATVIGDVRMAKDSSIWFPQTMGWYLQFDVGFFRVTSSEIICR